MIVGINDQEPDLNETLHAFRMTENFAGRSERARRPCAPLGWEEARLGTWT